MYTQAPYPDPSQAPEKCLDCPFQQKCLEESLSHEIIGRSDFADIWMSVADLALKDCRHGEPSAYEHEKRSLVLGDRDILDLRCNTFAPRPALRDNLYVIRLTIPTGPNIITRLRQLFRPQDSAQLDR